MIFTSLVLGSAFSIFPSVLMKPGSRVTNASASIYNNTYNKNKTANPFDAYDPKNWSGVITKGGGYSSGLLSSLGGRYSKDLGISSIRRFGNWIQAKEYTADYWKGMHEKAQSKITNSADDVWGHRVKIAQTMEKTISEVDGKVLGKMRARTMLGRGTALAVTAIGVGLTMRGLFASKRERSY